MDTPVQPLKYNHRQERLLATMRSVQYATLVQGNGTATWYVEGIWPIKIRMRLTCRDVHELVRTKRIASGPWGRILLS